MVYSRSKKADSQMKTLVRLIGKDGRVHKEVNLDHEKLCTSSMIVKRNGYYYAFKRIEGTTPVFAEVNQPWDISNET